MIAQLKAAATRPDAKIPAIQTEPAAAKVNFADALKGALDSVNTAQKTSADLGRRFTLGDDKVSLSDVMVASQKPASSSRRRCRCAINWCRPTTRS